MKADGADLVANCSVRSFGASSCLYVSPNLWCLSLSHGWRGLVTGPHCTLLMSVPRQKLEFDVFPLPQVKRELHAAVEQQAKENNKLIKLFLYWRSFNDATSLFPLTSLMLCEDLLVRKSVVSLLCEL